MSVAAQLDTRGGTGSGICRSRQIVAVRRSLSSSFRRDLPLTCTPNQWIRRSSQIFDDVHFEAVRVSS